MSVCASKIRNKQRPGGKNIYKATRGFLRQDRVRGSQQLGVLGNSNSLPKARRHKVEFS